MNLADLPFAALDRLEVYRGFAPPEFPVAQLGGPGFIEDLVSSFEEDSDRALRDVERALAAQDYGQWHDQLHMLKGGASDVGAHLLAQRCAEAERLKPFELSSGLAQARLDEVRTGWPTR